MLERRHLMPWDGVMLMLDGMTKNWSDGAIPRYWLATCRPNYPLAVAFSQSSPLAPVKAVDELKEEAKKVETPKETAPTPAASKACRAGEA
jgi:hypothetical protein